MNKQLLKTYTCCACTAMLTLTSCSVKKLNSVTTQPLVVKQLDDLVTPAITTARILYNVYKAGNRFFYDLRNAPAVNSEVFVVTSVHTASY